LFIFPDFKEVLITAKWATKEKFVVETIQKKSQSRRQHSQRSIGRDLQVPEFLTLNLEPQKKPRMFSRMKTSAALTACVKSAL
jgi:hypothetical protein